MIESEKVNLADSRFGVGGEEHFVVALAQKSHFERVSLHENSIQLTCGERAELDCTRRPAHYMVRTHGR